MEQLPEGIREEPKEQRQPDRLDEAMQELFADDGPAFDSLESTKAVSNPIESYPVEKQKTIRSFLRSVDENLKSFVKQVKNGDLTFRRMKLSNVSDRAANDIKALIGIDVSGYTNNINTNGIKHTLNRHGENGSESGHDISMELDDDIARIRWVLDNYDSVEPLTEKGQQVYSSEFMDKDNRPASQLRFIKKIDGTYYVVEAVCENKYKKLWVQSAYLQKNKGDVTQAPAEGLSANHETNARSDLASPSPAISISESSPEVNGDPVPNSDYYDEFEDWGRDSNREGVENPMGNYVRI